jgi:hypothetical protein
MAKKKETDDLAGTVEGQARDHFEMEKKAYEERTGETVEFVPPMPTTRTPIVPEQVEEIEPAKDEDAAGDKPAAEDNQSEGA